MKNKETFQVKIDDKDVEIAVIKPNQRQLDDAQKVYNRKYCELVNSKALLRLETEKLLKDRGLWGDEEEEEIKKLRKQILKSERKLLSGGTKLSEAKSIALTMIKDRNKLFELSLKRSALDAQTAEAQAEQHRFNYLVSICAVYNNNDTRVFENLEDYLEKSDEEWAISCANKLAQLMTNIEDYKAKLPENKFLIKYGFMNDQYQFVDKQKRLVNEEGKHIDKDGRFIKWIGNDKTDFIYVDMDGNEVNKDGDYVVEFEPFIDDAGLPVSVE